MKRMNPKPRKEADSITFMRHVIGFQFLSFILLYISDYF